MRAFAPLRSRALSDACCTMRDASSSVMVETSFVASSPWPVLQPATPSERCLLARVTLLNHIKTGWKIAHLTADKSFQLPSTPPVAAQSMYLRCDSRWLHSAVLEQHPAPRERVRNWHCKQLIAPMTQVHRCSDGREPATIIKDGRLVPNGHKGTTSNVTSLRAQ